MKLTDDMLRAVATPAGVLTLDSCRKVREVLAAAGVTGLELHPLEIERVIVVQGEARAAWREAERYLARGPLPEHTCEVDEHGIVTPARCCPFGCRSGAQRRTVELDA